LSEATREEISLQPDTVRIIVPRALRLYFTRQLALDVFNALFAGALYLFIALWFVLPPVQHLYDGNNIAYFAPTHFNDARQYTFTCIQGYNIVSTPSPVLWSSRINWMPIYGMIQCAANRLSGFSFVYLPLIISAYMAVAALLFAILVLRSLDVPRARLAAWIVLIPVVGGAWLYLPSVEITFYAIGMLVLYLVLRPPANPRVELARAVVAFGLGGVFILTKPNALAMLLPLLFAFVYQSWRASQAEGYAGGLLEFTADLVIANCKPLVRGAAASFNREIFWEQKPLRYQWTALMLMAGITFGFALWIYWTSIISGIPVYFLNQQLLRWGRAWPPGNISEMLIYFRQPFIDVLSARPAQLASLADLVSALNTAVPFKPWRLSAGWNLLAYIAALLPAGSRRVPGLIRVMLPLMVLFLLASGAAHGSDRYVLSTAIVGIGWACWFAPRRSLRRPAPWLRLAFVLLLSWALSSYLLNQMMPLGLPDAYGIEDRP